MDAGTVVQANVEQNAAASWNLYLKQLRVSRMFEALSEQKESFENAVEEIESARFTIWNWLIDRNRGGERGLHGFIAEAAQNGIDRASRAIEGIKYPDCDWLNDNGPADLARDGILIQQKFVESGKLLSLNAVIEHLNKYPTFIAEGGKYQIPADYYDKVKELFNMPMEATTTLSKDDYRLWKYVHKTLDGERISLKDLEPSALKYAEAQKGAYNERLDKEIETLKKRNDELNAEIEGKNKPSLKEAGTAVVFSAAIEGGVTFVSEVLKKKKGGKLLKDFSEEDWKDILLKSGYHTGTGAVRGGVLYVTENFTKAPTAVASAIITATINVAELFYKFDRGKITKKEFYNEAEKACISATVSGLSSMLGQALIPIPVIGVVIGNTFGNLMYQTALDCQKSEMDLVHSYTRSIEEKTNALNLEYQLLSKKLEKEFGVFSDILKDAYSANYLTAFVASIRTARWSGVPEADILHSKKERDDFFLN